MIKTPLSTVIGGAFWTPNATILGGTSKTFDQLIKSLFANNEQGFFYDPNDLSTMYQDAAGTVPVTGAGQPVGLVLDKSKGLVVGVERLTNGDFSAGSAGWTVVGNDATHIITFANGTMRYQSDTGTPVLAAQQLNTLTVGKWYEVTITISNYVSGALKSDGFGWLIFPSSTGTYKLRAIATSTTFNLLRQTPNVDITIDSVSIKELAGNHAYQTTSASRPILRQNATTGAYYLEFDGSDDFLQTNSIDFTSTDKVSLFAGVRKLGDAVQQCLVELSVGVSNGSFSLWSPPYANGKNFAFWSKGTVLNPNAYNTGTETGAYVVTGRGAILTKIAELRVNGAQKALSNADQGAGNYGNHPLYIGRRNGNAFTFTGHIYSLIGVGRLTTDSEVVAIEKELAKRSGVTLSV